VLSKESQAILSIHDPAHARKAGLIEKSADANLGMPGLAADSASCWGRLGAPWDTAFRWSANDRVSEADILAGHFQSTHDRAAATDGLVLVLHDTTEFSYQREKSAAIGITKSINSGRDKAGRLRSHTVCGILMHSSLAVTIEGVPLGLAAVKFWTRKKFKGTAALKKKINPTRIPIEKKRKHPVVGKSEAIDRATGRSGTMRPYW
jgi:hypothetical protein